MTKLSSAQAPDFQSEKAYQLSIIDTMASATAHRGISVLERGLRFIIRLRGDRHLAVRGQLRRADELARGVRLR
jgi:hypothetical protein